ncbi:MULTISPECIES: SUMF1/EgtB/PvdO family nonheme iron enzyme [unclassified Limnothrix]|uniref:SUMF1/EgtB/PvdO family nonheme iron enzyme n=1 Tax=unclassified Limnothrix TaxID=2632864 RepID=UPI0018EFE23A|nr:MULTISPECIES: SUMF1/EgtB/PvdO family nonheme iron enzyme [unclassified Limnothrix]
MGGQHYAIVVGINKYKRLDDLKYAERDALALYGALYKAGFFHVELITSFSHFSNETSVNFDDLHEYIVKTIPTKKLRPDSILWFFFAGHGKRIAKPSDPSNVEDYLLTYEASPDFGRDEFSIGWFPVERIVQSLKQTGSKNIILCLDACRASRDGRSGSGDSESIQGIYEGVATLFACQKNQISYEIEQLRHGVFTYALLEVLSEQSCPTVRELSDYLERRVPKLCSEHQKKHLQVPICQVAGDFKWTLPALPNAQLQAAKPNLQVLIQAARQAESDAFDLLQDKFDLEKLEIAKNTWWQVISADPNNSEARQELEKILQRITRRQIDLLHSQNKQTEPNQYFISAEPGAVIQFATAPPSGDSEPVPAEVSRAVEPPPPAPPKPKPQPKPQPPDPFAGWSLREWSFETVRVDRAGQVVERLPKTARSHFVDLGEGVQLELVAIPGGQFQMGSPDDEKQRDSDEGPVRTVTVPPLLMSRYPITVQQWRRVAGSFPAVLNPKLNADPSNWKDAKGPIERVNWFDAMEFCARLSKATDRLYRLPSEAEWEYACRAGTQTPFAFGETLTTELANYDGHYTYADGPKGEYRQRTTPVGQFPPNGFGLQDMHGNVWEWCLDDWHENYQGAPVDGRPWFNNQKHEQVFIRQFQESRQMDNGAFQNLTNVDNEQHKLLRGGSWYCNPRLCRSANRYWGRADGRDFLNYDVGFRVVVLP